ALDLVTLRVVDQPEVGVGIPPWLVGGELASCDPVADPVLEVVLLVTGRNSLNEVALGTSPLTLQEHLLDCTQRDSRLLDRRCCTTESGAHCTWTSYRPRVWEAGAARPCRQTERREVMQPATARSARSPRCSGRRASPAAGRTRRSVRRPRRPSTRRRHAAPAPRRRRSGGRSRSSPRGSAAPADRRARSARDGGSAPAICSR